MAEIWFLSWPRAWRNCVGSWIFPPSISPGGKRRTVRYHLIPSQQAYRRVVSEISSPPITGLTCRRENILRQGRIRDIIPRQDMEAGRLSDIIKLVVAS